MPNASVLEAKKAIVAELTEKIQKLPPACSWITRASPLRRTPRLRRECRENGVDYAVVKNTCSALPQQHRPERAGRSAQRRHVSGRVHG